MIFLEKVTKGGTYKLVPMKGQGYDTDLNVSATPKSAWFDSDKTIFYCYHLSKVSGVGKDFYKTSGVYEVDTDGKDYKDYINKLKEAAEKAETAEKIKEEPEDTLLKEISSDESLKAPSSKIDGFYVSNDDWSLLVRNVQRHVNTMIIGPTGCGKTSVVREICKRMGKKLYTFDMGTMMDPVSSLLGVHRLDKGESIFDYAKFTQVIKEPCVILLDELSRAPLSAMNVLFSCLDDRRNLNIEIAMGSGEREIEVNPEVTFIATAMKPMRSTAPCAPRRACSSATAMARCCVVMTSHSPTTRKSVQPILATLPTTKGERSVTTCRTRPGFL